VIGISLARKRDERAAQLVSNSPGMRARAGHGTGLVNIVESERNVESVRRAPFAAIKRRGEIHLIHPCRPLIPCARVSLFHLPSP